MPPFSPLRHASAAACFTLICFTLLLPPDDTLPFLRRCHADAASAIAAAAVCRRYDDYCAPRQLPPPMIDAFTLTSAGYTPRFAMRHMLIDDYDGAPPLRRYAAAAAQPFRYAVAVIFACY